MGIISYAQNLEDVMLYRALKHVERGFYIDVGAQHPINDSVTKAFYDLGWRGINIEPVIEYFNLLQQHRPNDINLNIAVGAHKGKVVLHEVLDTGASSVIKNYAESYARNGYQIKSRTVTCTTLDTLCAKNKVGTIHFLKIDVEGAERSVIEGFSFTKVRPWIVVVEATIPNSQADISHEWEPLITSKDYKFVYFDGLNRYYIALEQARLQVHFTTPPNIFDGYIPYQQWLAQQELASEK
ncbi:MAG TPA: FkbM family methyltransferase, partial [Dehalococcoidia bacterium]|nr:FkbM family methyltransferase [Dehalococcoidia bacterium]